MDLKILFEDNHLIVCVKEAGILSQASHLDMPDMLTILKQYIKEKYHKPGNVYLGLVHRLDLNVGGVMVFAKTSKAASRLNNQIRHHQIDKQYFAVVRGDSGELHRPIVIENYLYKDHKNRKAIISNNPKDQRAKLVYETIDKIYDQDKVLSLLSIELMTGRFHQIRAQFANLGLPLYGDNKYGPKTKGYDIGLYAYQLTITHPTLKEEMTFFNYPTEGIFKNFKMFNGGEPNDSK